MIILTGASGGIGQQIIKPLSKFDNIIGIYNLTKPKIDLKNVSYIKINLLKEIEILKLIKKIGSSKEKITLINCAGVKKDNLIINQTYKEWKSVIDLNLSSSFLLSKHLLKKMIFNQWGRIIFISSSGARDGDLGTGAYSSSKTGLIGLSKVISKEYGKYNITSNIIELGAFDTGMYKKLNQKIKNNIIKKIPSDKLGQKEDIINTIKFIIDTNFMNGSVVKIDGGAD